MTPPGQVKPVDPSPFLSKELLGTVSHISPASDSYPLDAVVDDIVEVVVVIVVVVVFDFVVGVVEEDTFVITFDFVVMASRGSVSLSTGSINTRLSATRLSMFNSSLLITFLMLEMIDWIISSLTSCGFGREYNEEMLERNLCQ